VFHVIKSCANCRYLNLIDKGYEFKNILDSEYLVFRCSMRDWTVREDYLMKSPGEQLELSSSESRNTMCPFWEEWTEEETNDKEQHISDEYP